MTTHLLDGLAYGYHSFVSTAVFLAHHAAMRNWQGILRSQLLLYCVSDIEKDQFRSTSVCLPVHLLPHFTRDNLLGSLCIHIPGNYSNQLWLWHILVIGIIFKASSSICFSNVYFAVLKECPTQVGIYCLLKRYRRQVPQLAGKTSEFQFQLWKCSKLIEKSTLSRSIALHSLKKKWTHKFIHNIC